MLNIKNLNVTVENKKILNDFNLTIKDNEVHAIMGPNGIGKSTLSRVILRDDKYKVISGDVLFNDTDILKLSTDEVARLGIYLATQYPLSIEGVSNADLLRTSLSHDNKINLFKLVSDLENSYDELKLNKEYIHKSINEGFSGGERKKNEIIQMMMLKPKLIILDEIDSGVDVDNLKVIANAINKYKEENNASILIITHYPNILKYIKPDYVHMINNGTITKTGDYELAVDIERNGYE